MNYSIQITKQAKKDIDKQTPRLKQKIKVILIEVIAKNPFIGKFEATKEKIANVAEEVEEALNKKVEEMLDKGIERAKANGRRKLHARDL